jgi:dihydrofolate reductase
MADEMSLKQLPLTLIVAATPKNGIGKNGGLPWPMLKKEMAYFARVTKRVPLPTGTGSVQSDAWKQTNLEGTQRNAVIMGRKTWDSIPPKFRPLKDRTNVVISTQDRTKIGGIPDDVVVTSDILSALDALEQFVKDGKALPVGRAYVIGGASIYKAALKLPQTKSILLTRINMEFDCDTFFPEEVGSTGSSWQKSSREDLERFVGESIPAEALVEGEGDQATAFEFQLYQRT